MCFNTLILIMTALECAVFVAIAGRLCVATAVFIKDATTTTNAASATCPLVAFFLLPSAVTLTRAE